MTVKTLLTAMADRQVSAAGLCETALASIEAGADTVNALSYVRADRARAEAEAVDARRRRGMPLGRLAGIPVVVKDIIDVEGAICGAGLDIFSDYRASADAEVVRRLRAADAIILGMGRTDSGAFGVTTQDVVNPLDPARVAGGSSGGSAAAVAAGWCAFAVGTDTGGSIRIPAACCGVVGFKPTKGHVSTEGVRPLAVSFDHVGPIVRSAGDLALIMDVMADRGEPVPPAAGPQYYRVGYSQTYCSDAAPEITRAFEDFLGWLERQGHSVECVDLPSPDEVMPAHLAGSLTEAAAYYRQMFPHLLSALPPDAASGVAFAENVHGYDFLWALETLKDVARRIERCFAIVDFLVLPTLPCIPPSKDAGSVIWKDRELSVLSALIRNTALFNHSGYPVLAMPLASLLPGTPLAASVQIVGNRRRDDDVIAFATTLEGSRISA